MPNTFQDFQKELASGKTTCENTVRSFLERIEKNRHLNAFLEVYGEESLKRAKEIDTKIKEKKAGRLAGMVVALKDNICYKDHRVSASSKILEGFISLYNATVTERLLNEDAIIIGRCNCDEFAMGSSNENSAYGKVLNPLDEKRVTGGSSGGSAAAVAAGLCHVAFGSDTGGSVRQPASFCGIVGLKPTYGRISRWGLLAYASSFDQIGPFAGTIYDAALVTEIISGKDDFDSTASQIPVPSYTAALKNNVTGTRIAYLKDCLENEGVDPEVKKQMTGLIEKLKQKGFTVEPVDFPYLDYLVPAYYILTTAEASSNLSRYDGIHYGYRSPNATDLESTYKKSRTEGFGTEVKRRIMLGTFVLSSGYYDAYYSKGQKVRRLLVNKVNDIFKEYDLLLSPTTPGTAFEFGKNADDPVKMYLEDIFTVLAPLTGIPAISIPLGKHSNGLPLGLQLMGRKFEESRLFSCSEFIMNIR